MRRIVLALLVAFAVLPASAQQPARPAAPRQAPERELMIQNQSSRTIVELYASSTRESEWGTDRLGSDTLAPGRSHRVRFGRTADCTFDIRVVYDDSSEEETRNHDVCRQRQIAFDGSRATGGRPPGEDRSFTLDNRHGRTVFQVFVGTAANDEWGDDLLGSETLTAGGTATISFRGGCEIRLRIVFDNDAAEERRGIDICSQTSVVVGPGWTTAEDLAAFGGGSGSGGATVPGGGFTLVNRSGKGILMLYVFPDGARQQGDDRLGSDIVANGARFAVRLDRGDQCRFTVRVVYEGPDPDEERSGVDLCATTELVIASGWTDAPLTGAGRVRNAGRLPIVELYADPPGSARGADRLGSETIAAGSSFDLRPPQDGQCRYQVTGVFRDGREASAEADLCAGEEVVLQ